MHYVKVLQIRLTEVSKQKAEFFLVESVECLIGILVSVIHVASAIIVTGPVHIHQGVSIAQLAKM